MNKKTVFYIFLSCATLICVVTISQLSNANLAQVLSAFIPPVITYFFIESFQKDKDKFLASISGDSSSDIDNCIILLVGIAGTGKTTLAKNWQFPNADTSVSTQDCQAYIKEKERDRDFKVTFLDYRGQNLGTLIDGDFAEKYKNNIFAIIFLVDLIPRENEIGNVFQSEEQQLQWLESVNKDDIYEKILRRIKAHFSYLGVAGIQSIFQKFSGNSLKLRYIRFLINKVDVMEKLQDHGNLPDKFSPNYKEKLKQEKYFVEYIETIRKFCREREYPITNFETDFISLNTGYNIYNVYHEIIEAHKKWREKYKWIEKGNILKSLDKIEKN
ncbi:MAG: hypothetical protein ACKO11_03390 [Cuspidothrix sp.]